MGLFTPKWKSKNKNKRHQWVKLADKENLRDLSILKKLIIKEEDDNIRNSAISLIDNACWLKEIVLESNKIDVRIQVLNKILSDDILNDKEKSNIGSPDKFLKYFKKELDNDILINLIDEKLERLKSEKNAEQKKIKDIVDSRKSKKSLKEEFKTKSTQRTKEADTNQKVRTQDKMQKTNLKDKSELINLIIENSERTTRNNAFNELKKLIRTDFSRTYFNRKDDFPDLDSREMAEASLNQITDQKQIEELAVLSPSRLAKETCIREIEDSKLLSVIALMDKDSSARYAAIDNNRFNNDKLLSQIAQNDKDDTVRGVATSKINNQDDLKEIALKNKSWMARKEAVSKIKDNSILSDIIEKEEHHEVLDNIVINENFTNQKLLLDIANAKYEKFGASAIEFALEKITDENILQQYASKLEIDDLRWIHLMNNKSFTDNSKIEEIAINKESRARDLAIKRVKNQSLLKSIILDKEEFDTYRILAVEKIEGMMILKSVINEVNNYNVSEAIKKRLGIY